MFFTLGIWIFWEKYIYLIMVMLSRLKSIIASIVLIISSVLNIYSAGRCCKCGRNNSNTGTSGNNGGKDGGSNITTKNITLDSSSKTLDLDGTKLTAVEGTDAKTAEIVDNDFYDAKGAESFTIWESTDKNVFDGYKQKNININFTGGTNTHILALVHIKYGKDNHKYYYVYCSDGNSDNNNYAMFRYLVEIEEVIILSTGDKLEDLHNMFRGCPSLTSVIFLNVHTENVTNTSYMFNECSSLTSLDLSNFDTQNVTNMNYMFNGCEKLGSLDLSKFDTKNVNGMNSMFYGCSSLSSLDLSKFNTENVTDMSFMFRECNSLKSLVLSNFNTGNVITMESMFEECKSLKSLVLFNFNTENVNNMNSMFFGCKSLISLNLSSFNTQNVGDTEHMFGDCNGGLQIIVGNNINKEKDKLIVQLGANGFTLGEKGIYSQSAD